MRINGEVVAVPAEWRDASLLTFLRDHLGMTGTKFGCGGGFCGACTVHLDGEAAFACLLPVSALEGRSITTIEGLAGRDALHPVQQAWVEGAVPQCGYCQPGQIMKAAAFLESNPAPTREEVERAMSTNLCRCGTYVRIRTAVLRAAELRSRR
jgi:aerobic-type carbon monoxide dehydrogenase small subunit (CoxS/CutS family)